MVSDNPGGTSADVCDRLYPPGYDPGGDMDDRFLLHPAVKYNLVAVNWLDSHGGQEGWEHVSDCEFTPPANVWTVGFLVNEDPVCIEVTQCISDTGGSEHRMYSVTIPRVCIQQFVHLTHAFDKKVDT